MSRSSDGPIVVHFSSTDTMNNIPIRKVFQSRRPSSCYIVAIGVLIALVMMFMLWEQQGELTNSGLGLSASLSKFGNPVEGEQQQQSKLKAAFDVNAPPVPFGDIGIGSDGDDDDFDKKSLSYWGNHQSIRLKVNEESQEEEKRRKWNRHKKLRPFPVIELDDDSVPQGVSGSIIHAADALLCRESVIDYVINATDLKDECDGLKKAFTKTCADESHDGEEMPLPSDVSGSSQQQQQQQQRRRRLVTVADGGYYDQSMEERNERNPLIYWQYRIHRLVHHIRYHHWLFRRQEAVFMAEDAILMEWEEAQYQVQNNLDSTSFHDHNTYNIRHQRQKRQLETDNNLSNASPVTTISSTVSSEAGHINKTKVVGTNVNKPKLSLQLPTTNHHVSEKMLSETLMLRNEGRIISSAVKASQNHTNNTTTTAASAYAAASNKAMSDTSELVSSVLNDPTSVEARTCCASILNVFHESCSIDEEEDLSDKQLFLVVFVIALCGLVKSLIRHFHLRWLPEAAGCILVGACAGWVLMHFPHHDISFDGNWFLRVMVPPIVFEAALGIDKRSFNRHVIPILIYAVIGTLVATALTAVVVHKGSIYFRGFCETIPVIEALTFGALISSIDPIAVLSVLSNMGMSDTDTIYVLIFGESLLNDGVAIVLFQTLVHFLDENIHVDGHAIAAASLHFLVVAIGSLLVGVGSGACCTIYYWAMHGCQTPLVEVLMFCCWALLPYYICDGIEWSGIVSVVATGFMMDLYVVGQKEEISNDGADSVSPSSLKNKSRTSSPRGQHQTPRRRRPIFSRDGHLSGHSKTHIGFVTEILATTMETAIFAYLGLFLFNSRYHWNSYHTGLAILGCCLSRAIMIPILSFVANWITKSQRGGSSCGSQRPQLPHSSSSRGLDGHKNQAGVVIDKKMQLVLWFAGLRGAMSFALVEHIPLYDGETGEGSRLKSELKAMTSASIFFTVFVLGGSTFYMMEIMGMTPPPEGGNSSSYGTKEMELIGLLSKRVSGDDDDENDQDFSSSQGSLGDFHHPRDGQSSNQQQSIFRQRIQQNPA